MISTEILAVQSTLPARDQGQRKTCLAFALTALTHPVSPIGEELSPEYLYHSAASQSPEWVPGAGLRLAPALAAASQIALEVDCPYSPVDPPFPLPPLPTGMPLYGAPVSEIFITQAALIDELRKGKAVGIGLLLTEKFYVPNDGRVIDGGLVVPDSGHALSIVGLGWEEGIPFFLIQNSWGSGWGDAGSAWISWNYIKFHALCAFGT
ncbi:hypothetical protein DYQ94_14625 [Xanthomonas sp. LMG 8993]|uniref:C1 family peptidase n=1 Tax=Xanthomonas TaxID=338 RepID=UPI001369DD06|nr:MULTISPECIES: C1 family peptidase [Xanthomonas]MBB4767676.1 hypothetical protein [Xanthomonas arboricola]MXV48115.1 hypothetical protein [Xanthomonas sp. LMG 8993]